MCLPPPGNAEFSRPGFVGFLPLCFTCDADSFCALVLWVVWVLGSHCCGEKVVGERTKSHSLVHLVPQAGLDRRHRDK